MALSFPWLDGIITRTTIWGDDGLGTAYPVKVNDQGQLEVNAQVTVPPVTAVTSAVATAAPPTYVEGSTNPLSMDLNGGIRFTGSVVATNPSVSTIAAAVPASGTYIGMNVGGNLVGLTGTGTSLNVSQTDRQASGNITNNQTVVLNTEGLGGCKVSISGTWTGTLVIEQTVDNTTWYSYGVFPLPTSRGLPLTANITSNGLYMFNGSGARSVRVRGNTVTSGTAVVTMDGGTSPALVTTNLIDDGVVLSGLSTATPLLANGVWTSTATDLLAFASITIWIYSDVPSANNGVVGEWSADGVVWATSTPFTYTDNGLPAHFTLNRRARYFRATYTNSNSAQASFYIQTIGQKVSPQTQTVGLVETLSGMDAGILTRSVITGYTTGGGGGYVNVKVNPSGALTTESTISSGTITSITNAVTVQQSTASNLKAQVVGSDGSVLATANTGRLQVDIVSGGGSNASVSATGAAVPASATYGGMNVGGNLVGFTGTGTSLNVNVTNSPTTTPVAHANAAPPTYVEDTDVSLSTDLRGNLRVQVTGGGVDEMPGAAVKFDNFANFVSDVEVDYSYDGGTTWVQTSFFNLQTLVATQTLSFNNPANVAQYYGLILTSLVTDVRFRNVNFVSGTADATIEYYDQSRLRDWINVTPTPTSWGQVVRNIPIKSTGSAVTQVASSATNVTLLAANAARIGVSIYNYSQAVLYVKLGSTASTSSFTTAVFPGGLYEVPDDYTGRIDGIWASADGSAMVTERT